ncbi:MAG: ATP-binding cassette domain-containing protein [Erysipelotrichaceae bacterium]
MLPIKIKGLKQNNLKNVDLEIPKNKITVFTGVSGSGKSSIVFDTIASESQRQMNETYSSWVRSRLPKYPKADFESIENLNPSVIIDQSRIVGNDRSTVGTISDMYSLLRLIFSRIGQPSIGPASMFSFNNPNGMCKRCTGLGSILEFKIDAFIYQDKSYDQGCFNLPSFKPGNYYFKLYRHPEIFRCDVPFKDLSEKEQNFLLYGSYSKDGERIDKKVEGVYNQFKRLLLLKSDDQQNDTTLKKISQYLYKRPCPDCQGKRLNPLALSCKIKGYDIYQLSQLEFSQLRDFLLTLNEPTVQTVIDQLVLSLERMIEIGLPYLSLNRPTATLSGGEAQRLKLVRYMGSSLTNLIYIFDEPSTGMHPRDIYRMAKLLRDLADKGNTVLVVEHDKDIISIADNIVDVGPLAGKYGGEILFCGTYQNLLLTNTLTSQAMKEKTVVTQQVRTAKSFLPIRNANTNNLKNVNVDIPLNILTVVTGVAGSGKSSLIRQELIKQYPNETILIDQSPITATSRSTICTYLSFFDQIRKEFAQVNQVSQSLFTFNGQGGCPYCKGKGVITTELIFMEPITTTCEYCQGNKYSQQALTYRYKDKNIVDVLNMSVLQAREFFADQDKIRNKLDTLIEVGLDYIALGQTLDSFSGGERQRVKLAENIKKKGKIYILDEPTTGLHSSDIKKIMKVLQSIVDKGNTVIVIEHNIDVIKQADYLIDIGPDGGKNGGEVVFSGTVGQMIENSNTITAQYLRKSL